ncbi:MAG TPA: polysaccharide deacetylase family protein [Candidatus Rubrimentiphilum sp.]|nr:polysaccharide deacetylase family protein [Candidatus Rubrimentiphilum sp.]
MRHLLLLAVLTVAVTAGAPPAVPQALSVPPILMYHRVDTQIPSDPVGRDLTVTPAALAMQLQTLRSRHLKAISMAELFARLHRNLPIEDAVVLTFDDGYADQMRYALPLLRRYGARATFYIVTGTLGTPEHLTWADLRRMTALGMDLGAHGIAHDDLSLMTARQQQAQIFGSVRALRRRLHAAVLSYAYPSGRFNTATLQLVRQAGIQLAVTTDPRYVIPPANRFELTRVRVHGAWSYAAFAAAITAAQLAGQTVPR